MRFLIPVSVGLFCCALLASRNISAQQNPDGRLPIGSYDNPLIFLLRDDEVLRDLKATPEQRASLRQLADKLDAMIWPARNQSAERSNAAWAEATTIARREGTEILNDSQQRRVEQIILWIQGTRALSRDDVAEKLQLNESQRKEIQEILAATNKEIDALRKRAADGESAAPLEEKARELRLAEQRQLLDKLTESQRRNWVALAGGRIDVSKLGRVSFHAPPLVAKASDWLNGSVSAGQQKGRVMAVHFFANGCINCQRNYEHYRGWDESFRDRGLLIIGIHTPETQAEHDVDRLRRKVAEAGFKFPILVDNERENWNAWGNSMWPSVYLVDRHGHIRYWWYGELNWQGAEGEKVLRTRIEELLAESDT